VQEKPFFNYRDGSPKNNILSLITQLNVIPNLLDFLFFSVEHKRSSFEHTMEVNGDKLKRAALISLKYLCTWICIRLNNDDIILIILTRVIDLARLQSHSRTHLLNTNTPAPQVTVILDMKTPVLYRLCFQPRSEIILKSSCVFVSF